MKLKHLFQMEHPAKTLALGCESIDQYMDRVRDYAVTKRLDPDEQCDLERKIIGDGFELFGEFFVRHYATDNRILIRDYSLLTISDNGIDARGVDDRTGYPVFIQYKGYREYYGDKAVVLTGEHLNTFVAECYMVLREENASKEQYDNARMVVITTARELARYTKETKFRNLVECFPVQHLRDLTISRGFWEQFAESIRSV